MRHQGTSRFGGGSTSGSRESMCAFSLSGVPIPTSRYIQKLKDMQAQGTLPPPIMFHQHFYSDGKALSLAFPEATCLV
eukprot:m.164156 g.164156  ORF g.164156 m.164156 type:complete len:78 (-) comp23934_c0_seq11:1560-1793(-)